MNKDTINLPRLISLIAEGASVSPATARRFLHDLFAYIEERLTAGETVNIKGIGEFVNSGDPANPVLFKADEELAAIANEPFSAFSAVTLNEEAVDEIESVGKKEETLVESVTAPAPAPVVEPIAKETVEVEKAAEKAPVEETEQAPAVPTEIEVGSDEAIKEPEPVQTDTEVVEEPLAAEPDKEPEQNPNVGNSPDAATSEQSENEADVPAEDEVKPERRYAQAPGYRRSARRRDMAHTQKPQNSHSLWLVLGILIGLILGLVGGYFAGKTMAAYELPEEDYSIFDEVDADTIALSTTPVVRDSTVSQDTAHQKTAVGVENKNTSKPAKEEPVPAKKAEPVYDTITSTRYLSILARDHYGVKNYWIFIYEANPQLGNPNQIRPGTRVLIPSKESFQEATKAETDAKAQRLLNQLAKKYKL